MANSIDKTKTSFLPTLSCTFARFWLCCIAFGGLFVAPLTAQEKPSGCQLRFAWTDWPPYLEIKGKKVVGLQAELVSWIADEMDCRLAYKKLTWEESIAAIKTGSVDVLGRASYSKPREMFAWFSDGYREDLLVLTVRKSDLDRYQVDDLKSLFDGGFKVGIIYGGFLGQEIERYRTSVEYKNNFVYYPLEKDIIEGIDKGEVDGIFEAPFTVDAAQMNMPLDNKLVQYPLEIVVGSLHFMFSKKSVDLARVEQFNQALAKVKQSKRYREHWYWKRIR